MLSLYDPSSEPTKHGDVNGTGGVPLGLAFFFFRVRRLACSASLAVASSSASIQLFRNSGGPDIYT